MLLEGTVLLVKPAVRRLRPPLTADLRPPGGDGRYRPAVAAAERKLMIDRQDADVRSPAEDGAFLLPSMLIPRRARARRAIRPCQEQEHHQREQRHFCPAGPGVPLLPIPVTSS